MDGKSKKIVNYSIRYTLRLTEEQAFKLECLKAKSQKNYADILRDCFDTYCEGKENEMKRHGEGERKEMAKRMRMYYDGIEKDCQK